MITIYLAHALSAAPVSFRQRMLKLREAINALEGVKVLEFAWIEGQGADPSVSNIYMYDMEHVNSAGLMVGVLDHTSFGLAMEIQERCQNGDPIRLFFPQGTKVPRIVADCVSYFRVTNHNDEMPDPIEYQNDAEILSYIAEWISNRRGNLAFEG